MATEGNLQAPTRHPLDWKNPDFFNEDSALHEMRTREPSRPMR